MIDEVSFRNKINLYKMFLAIGVVLIHAFNVEVYQLNGNGTNAENIVYGIEVFTHGIFGVCVPFFFILSGFLFYRNYEFTWKCIKEKYCNRLFSLLIPYCIWIFLGFIYYVLLTHIPFTASRMNMECVDCSFSTLFNGLITSAFDSPLWYMRVLICYIVLNPLVFVVLKNWHKKIWTGLISLTIIVLVNIFISSEYYQIPFFVGAYIGINHKELLHIKNVILRNLGIVVAAITGAMLGISDFGCINYCNGVVLVLLKTVFAFSLWYAFSYLDYERKFPYLGTITFFLYVSHSMIIEGLEKLFLICFGTGPIQALLDYLVATFIVVIIIIAISLLLKKTKYFWKIINGRRL